MSVSSTYVAVGVRNHPARVAVYNLHLPECHWANSGDPQPTTLADFAIGTLTGRANVPPSTGWVYGKGSAKGAPDAPVWISDNALRFTCQSCLKGRSAASL
jgi:hypothetical protein